MSGYTASAGQVNAAPKANPIPAACGELDNSIAFLHDRLSLLEQRLAAVLSPLPPASVGEGKPNTARHSMALMIESSAGGVRAAGDRVDSLINRLEL